MSGAADPRRVSGAANSRRGSDAADPRRVRGAANSRRGSDAEDPGLGDRPGRPGPDAPGVYVHVPFCARICPYCDFAVTPLRRGFGRYRRSLLGEVELRAAPLHADTVYFGGGTPSLAPTDFFAEVVAALVGRGLAASSPFVFVETNPEDLSRDPGLAGRLAAEGVSGVSLGAQALDDRRLRFLGRVHTGADIRIAARRLSDAGIPWISLDLIYGTAGQSSESLRAELIAAASLPGANHLSAYELTVEPETPFGRRAAAGERLTAAGAFFPLVHEVLAGNGFHAYEASSFAPAPEYRSRHNRKYWSGAPYLGFGPAAHSFAPGRAERFWNHRRLEDWEAALDRGEPPTASRETLTLGQLALEELFLRLRTTDGLDLRGFGARYGEAVLAANRELLRKWERRGLARFEGGRLAPTLAGLAVADALAREVDLGLIERNAA